MFAPICRGRAAGIVAGYFADLLLGDPRRGHPVALFGRGAAALERVTYSDARSAGVVHTGVLLGALGVLGVAAERFAARRGPAWTAAATAAATYVALGGTSLTRTGERMAGLLEGADVGAARRLLPSLCGRDPAVLDAAGLTRAALESVAENTSDAQVAPLLWAAVGGVPAVLVYRGANTLDAMIGHRSPRYARFGWAAARFDDAAQLRRGAGDGAAGGGVRTAGGRITRGRRCAPGVATRPATPVRTPGWWRRRSPERWACGSAGRRSMPTSWRSGPRSATAESPRSRICAGRCGCRARCRCCGRAGGRVAQRRRP